MLKYMLDSNIAIYVIKRRPIAALEKFNQCASQMCVSSITVAELIHGAEKSQHSQQAFAVVEDFLSRLSILDYDYAAAGHYGDIRANLGQKGTPIGVNDLHIAGHARSAGLILVSNNLREFERVDGLRLANWV